jgi:hypothetical protein
LGQVVRNHNSIITITALNTPASCGLFIAYKKMVGLMRTVKVFVYRGELKSNPRRYEGHEVLIKKQWRIQPLSAILITIAFFPCSAKNISGGVLN